MKTVFISKTPRLNKVLLSVVAIGFSLLGSVNVSSAQSFKASRDFIKIPKQAEINVPCCLCGKGNSTIIDLSTGVAPWSSPQGAVSMIGVYPGWKVPNPPARWVYAGTNAVGNYTYNLKINVPKNCNTSPKVSFMGTGWGDNNITVRMDDRVLGTTAVSSGGQANYGFRDPYGVNVSGTIGGGSHILSVTVRNDESATGFLFDGKLKIECPLSDNPYSSGNSPVY